MLLLKINYFLNKYILVNLVWLYIFYKDLNINLNTLNVSNFFIIFKFLYLNESLKKCLKLFSFFILIIYFIVFLNILKIYSFIDAEEVVGICLFITFFCLILLLNEYMAKFYLSNYICKYNKLILYQFALDLYQYDCIILNIQFLKLLDILNDLLWQNQYYYNFIPFLKRKWNLRKIHILWYLQAKLILKALNIFVEERIYSKFILIKYIVLFKIMLLLNIN